MDPKMLPGSLTEIEGAEGIASAFSQGSCSSHLRLVKLMHPLGQFQSWPQLVLLHVRTQC